MKEGVRSQTKNPAHRPCGAQVERLLAHPEDRVDDTVEVLSKVLRQKEDALAGLQDEFGKVRAVGIASLPLSSDVSEGKVQTTLEKKRLGEAEERSQTGPSREPRRLQCTALGQD